MIAILGGLLLVTGPKRRRRRGLYALVAIVALSGLAALTQYVWGWVLLAGGFAAFVWHRWFYFPRRRRFHVKTLGELLALTPRQFEAAVGEILRDNGYRDVKHVGGAGHLRRGDGPGQLDRSVVVQCKRYSPGIRIGSRDIQEFIGMMTVHHRADRGVFITTTEFTEPATDLARQHGISIVDGQELTRLIAKANRNRSQSPESSTDQSQR